MSEFEAASKYVATSKGPKPDSATQLEYYALFKLATVGSCSVHGGAQPSFFNMTNRAKWDAWNKLGDLSKEEAEQKYVQLLDKHDPDWRLKK
jgi:acyl-CoA-binding protein